MKPTVVPTSKDSPPLLCQHCASLMRLVASEPHPVEAKTDLLTYCCTGCGAFQVIPFDLVA